jgi:hypothetical protein
MGRSFTLFFDMPGQRESPSGEDEEEEEEDEEERRR